MSEGGTPAPVLRLSGIRRRFVQGAAELEILKGVDLDLPPGRLAALVGPSGTGKSTLLHIAGLLERPTAGEVLIDGRPCSGLADSERTRLRRERIGFVYQFHHLLPDFTALENVMLPRRSSSPTSPPATSTRTRPGRCSRPWCAWPARAARRR
jgi:lipoprotein-releasing system ATP-binding protein